MLFRSVLSRGAGLEKLTANISTAEFMFWTPKFMTSVVKVKTLAKSTFIYTQLNIVNHRRHKFLSLNILDSGKCSKYRATMLKMKTPVALFSQHHATSPMGFSPLLLYAQNEDSGK